MNSNSSISILIPTYNETCLKLVQDLQNQCASISGLDYEILVADDGSTDLTKISINRNINTLINCNYLERKENIGRAAIRNFLAQSARYELLLFIDSHMSVISNNYISNYIIEKERPLVYGGYTISPDLHLNGNLRYSYEVANISKQDKEVRSSSPYTNFHTSNFMIHRKVMISFPLDERFKHYGYEDVLYGKTLKGHDIPIFHIDNPVGFDRFENNERYMEKTEEGMNTLYEFRIELKGYSRLLDLCSKLDKWHWGGFFRLLYKTHGKKMRQNLIGKSPSLLVFKLYRLCYFMSLL